MRKILALMMTLLMLLIVGCGEESASPDKKAATPEKKVELKIAAADSLEKVMKDLTEEYEKEHSDVKFNLAFNNTEVLQELIEKDVPNDIYIAADQEAMDGAEKLGKLVPDTRTDLLVNEMVIAMPKVSDKNISSFNDLTREDIQKIGVGEPNVSFGKYAAEIFAKLNISAAVAPKAAYASHLDTLIEAIADGKVDCGVIYASEVADNEKIRIACRAPEGSHEPLIYPAAILKISEQREAAQDFMKFLTSDKAKAIFEKHGLAQFPNMRQF